MKQSQFLSPQVATPEGLGVTNSSGAKMGNPVDYRLYQDGKVDGS